MRLSARPSKLFVALSTLVGGAFLGAPVAAQCSPPLLDFQNGYEPIQDMVFEGDNLFLATGLGGLVTLDISDPANIQEVSTYATPGYCSGVQVDGSIAYISLFSSQLFALDISDPLAPVALGLLDLQLNFFEYRIADGLAYLGTQSDGLQLVDVSDPTDMSVIGSYVLGSPVSGLLLVGDLLYLLHGQDGIGIVDVTIPTSPVFLGTLSGLGFLTDIEVQNGLAYLASLPSGLRIVDVSNPMAPVSMGGYVTSTQPRSIEVVDHVVFLGTTGPEILVLETLDPNAPELVGSTTTLNGSRTLQRKGGTLFSATSAGSARSYDVSVCLQPLGTSYCGPAVVNSSGQSARAIGLGSIAPSFNDMQVYAVDLPAGQASYVLTSQSQGFASMPGGSQGNLCLGGQIARFSSGVMSTDDYGNALFPIDLANIPTSPPQAVQSGQTWNFQVWFRDQNPGSTSNFTDALSVTFF